MEKEAAFDRIELNPRVCNGKPVVKGTRIPITLILDEIANGKTWETIIASWPELTREDIQAVLYYAKATLEDTKINKLKNAMSDKLFVQDLQEIENDFRHVDAEGW